MSKAEEMRALEEALHAEIQAELDAALADRDAANDRVKAARAKFAEAPRLHVKRTKKRGDDVRAEEVPAEVFIEREEFGARLFEREGSRGE